MPVKIVQDDCHKLLDERKKTNIRLKRLSMYLITAYDEIKSLEQAYYKNFKH